MGFFDFLKPKTDVLPFAHFEGIAFVNKGEIIALNFLDTSLKITDSKKQELLNIEYRQINNAEILTECEDKDKSVIGRAVVGGLLLGPVGAVVGGLSGVSKSKKNNYFLKITYDTDKILYLKGWLNSENICNIAKKQITEKVRG